MPFGCSVWPSFWSVGPNWPDNGEIDIVEGVNNKQMLVEFFFSFRRRFMSRFRNQYTFHTGANQKCSLSKKAPVVNGGPAFTGTVMKTNCKSSQSSNSGCAILDACKSSFGQGFAKAGGGVFALLRNSDGLKIWHFERQSIPHDVHSGDPDPDSWPTPNAFLSADNCAVDSLFSPQRLIIDTTLCGDWANGDYPHSGCPGTCTQRVTKGSNYLSAYLMNFLPVMLYRYESRCRMDYQFHNCVQLILENSFASLFWKHWTHFPSLRCSDSIYGLVTTNYLDIRCNILSSR